MIVQQNPKAYINLGIVCMQQKNYPEAVKNFRKAVKLDRYNSKAYALWGTCLAEIGEEKESAAVYELAKKYDSRNPEIYINWAISLAKFEKKAEAEEKFKTASLLDPSNPVIPLLWGVLLMEQKKYQEAIEKFTHSALFSSDKYDTAYYTALCCLKMKKFEKAVKFSRIAADLRPESSEPYLILGEAYMHLGNSGLSFNAYKNAAKNTRNNPAAYTGWGIALQKFQKFDEAGEKFFTALEMSPNDELLLTSLSVNFIMQKEYTEAEK